MKFRIYFHKLCIFSALKRREHFIFCNEADMAEGLSGNFDKKRGKNRKKLGKLCRNSWKKEFQSRI
jgi:hypothetical protein